MKTICAFFFWCLLLVLCWPLAFAALALAPIVWLLSIPFRILIGVVEAIMALVVQLFFLPARLVGWRRA